LENTTLQLAPTELHAWPSRLALQRFWTQLQFGTPHSSAQLFGYSSSSQTPEDNADVAVDAPAPDVSGSGALEHAAMMLTASSAKRQREVL
jgi:hypothetical protein